jgi:hypothetical protein
MTLLLPRGIVATSQDCLGKQPANLEVQLIFRVAQVFLRGIRRNNAAAAAGNFDWRAPVLAARTGL